MIQRQPFAQFRRCSESPVAADIKFCGMTRAEDVARASALGAGYVGVIFAGGPRNQTPQSAKTVLSAAPASLARVGVMGEQSPSEIAAIVSALDLGVVQLHADPSVERVRDVAEGTGAEVWAVVRVAGDDLPDDLTALAGVADAIVLDARVPGGLGGTGVTLPWAELSRKLERIRQHTRIVLAGGLRPENVEQAIGALAPDIVDVSSGIESAPGIKDHLRMEQFCEAVMRAGSVEKR